LGLWFIVYSLGFRIWNLEFVFWNFTIVSVFLFVVPKK